MLNALFILEVLLVFVCFWLPMYFLLFHVDVGEEGKGAISLLLTGLPNWLLSFLLLDNIGQGRKIS